MKDNHSTPSGNAHHEPPFQLHSNTSKRVTDTARFYLHVTDTTILCKNNFRSFGKAPALSA